MICNELLINRLPDIKRLAYWIRNRTGIEEDEATQELVLKLMETRIKVTEDNINKVLIGRSMDIIRQHARRRKNERDIQRRMIRERSKIIDDTVLIALEQLRQMNEKEQITLLRYMAGYRGEAERKLGYRIDTVRKTARRKCLTS